MPETNYKSLVDNLYWKTVTVKDGKKATHFCLHHVVEILWESTKFDPMTKVLSSKKQISNNHLPMGSGLVHSMSTKAAKKAAKKSKSDSSDVASEVSCGSDSKDKLAVECKNVAVELTEDEKYYCGS